MKIFYKNGFYIEGINQIPESAVEISEETYLALLNGQARGEQIIANERGEPILIEPAPTAYHQLKNGEWVISAEKQTALFEQSKTNLLQRLANQTDQLKSQVLAGYPQTEIDSFYVQEREAREWQADNTSPTPMLSAIAENRGVPLALLVEKVLEKANQLAGVMGGILGQKQAFEDRINTAKTQEDLTAVEQAMSQWKMPPVSP